MSDYRAVTSALARGDDPAMLCTTCPWDRNCINPPTMTRDDVEQKSRESMARAEAQGPDPTGERTAAAVIMTAIALGGQDTSSQVCPVFALRLRSGDGRKIAETVRGLMQGWED